MKENFTNKNENYQQVPEDRFNTIGFSEENDNKIIMIVVNPQLKMSTYSLTYGL